MIVEKFPAPMYLTISRIFRHASIASIFPPLPYKEFCRLAIMTKDITILQAAPIDGLADEWHISVCTNSISEILPGSALNSSCLFYRLYMIHNADSASLLGIREEREKRKRS